MSFIAPLAAAVAAPLTGGASLIPLVAGIAGAGISAVGAVEGGIATADAANYSAAVARNNAQVAEYNANRAIQAGGVKAETEGMKNAAEIGQTKASLAANGVDVNTGSAKDVLVGEREKSNLDERTIMNNAELEAYGYRTQETSFKSQAELDEAQAEQAPIGADLGAAGGLLSNASSLGFKWGGGGNSEGVLPGGAPLGQGGIGMA